MSLKCSITMVFPCPLLSWRAISSPFKENNNVVVFPFHYQIFMSLINLWFICLQGQEVVRSTALREGLRQTSTGINVMIDGETPSYVSSGLILPMYPGPWNARIGFKNLRSNLVLSGLEISKKCKTFISLYVLRFKHLWLSNCLFLPSQMIWI